MIDQGLAVAQLERQQLAVIRLGANNVLYRQADLGPGRRSKGDECERCCDAYCRQLDLHKRCPALGLSAPIPQPATLALPQRRQAPGPIWWLSAKTGRIMATGKSQGDGHAKPCHRGNSDPGALEQRRPGAGLWWRRRPLSAKSLCQQ